MDIGAIMSNKLLLGAVLAIVGLLGVLYAPKPINSYSLLVMALGVGLVLYTVVDKYVLSKPVSTAVPVSA